MSRTYYCGPWWMPNFIRRIFSYKFNASCKIHDLDYASGEFTRLEADVRFFSHMSRQANGWLFWEMVAVLYYVMARFVGRMSWKRIGPDAVEQAQD